MTTAQTLAITALATSLRTLCDTSVHNCPTVRVDRNTLELAPVCRVGRDLEVREDGSVRACNTGRVFEGSADEIALAFWHYVRCEVGSTVLPTPRG